jgi:serine/threonine protein phosphatase PrpC
MLKLSDTQSAAVRPATSTNEAINREQDALELQIGAHQDPGITRRYKPNEDTLFIIQGSMPPTASTSAATPLSLMLVADGMGGLGNGKEASRLAARTLYSYVTEALTSLPGTTEEDFLSILSGGVQRANQALYQRNRGQSTIGTTMTVVLVVGASAYVAHVGDSRLYRHQQGRGFTQLTRDHSVVAMLVEQGIISREDVYSHPRRNEIYRCLGDKAIVEIDAFSVSLEPGDILLLCSDGLWEMVRDGQISSILTTPVPTLADTAHALIQAALAGGGRDNVSAIVAKMGGEGR